MIKIFKVNDIGDEGAMTVSELLKRTTLAELDVGCFFILKKGKD